MIKLSEAEFEAKIQDVIAGRMSRVDLAKELQTDIRTLNKKIIEEIGVNNPSLYIEYIKKFPYKQKERDDLDYEALIIEMIKNRTHTVSAAIKYNIGIRTIQRKVNAVEKENPYLVSIYKEIKKNNKNNMPISLDLQEKIDQLVSRPVRISEVNRTRKMQLEEIERIFNNRCQYVSKTEAAESMGMSMNQIYKSLNKLYRIKIEEQYADMEETFVDSLKVDIQAQPAKLPENDKKETQTEKEGEEK